MALLRPIKRFAFTSEEIKEAEGSPQKWREFIRRKEVEIILSQLPRLEYNTALELGAGDGVQSRYLSPLAANLSALSLMKIGLVV